MVLQDIKHPMQKKIDEINAEEYIHAVTGIVESFMKHLTRVDR